MSNTDRIEQACRRGVAWLCCTCDKYWAARNAGIQGDSCMAAVAGQRCGSPLSGLAFPLYQGVVSSPSRFCFVCGAPSNRGMRARGSEKVFGVCEKHGPSWAANQRSPAIQVEPPEMTAQGNWLSLEEIPRRKSLREMMLEFDPQTFDPLPDDTEQK